MGNSPDTSSQRLIQVAYWIGCFCAPIALLIVLSAWSNVYPFGSQSFLTEDMKYQYVDLFSWFRKVLLGQTSLFYIDNTGLGTNSWGLVSYYLSSPFNILLLLFDEQHLTAFFWVTTALKLGAIQVSAVWYLRRRFDLSRSIAFLLAFCFVWSTWTASQLRNPLWMDALILLPLMEYAIYRLVRDLRWVPLVIVYAIAVVTCWYTAYMLAIFTGLFFILELVALSAERGSVELAHVVKCALLFVGAMVLALMLAAISFVPMVLAMSGGTSGEGLGAYDFFLRDPDVVFGSFFIGNWLRDFTPQHYAGMLLALLPIAFVLVRGIPARVKVVAVLLLAFMVASSFIAPLLYVWSGFRMPAGFYCRLSFMTVFLMMWMAAFACKAMWDGAPMALPLGGAAVALVVMSVVMLLQGWCVRDRYALMAAGLSVLLAVALVLLLRKKNPMLYFAVFALTGVCVFGELLYNAHVDWSQLYKDYDQRYHDTYVEEAKLQLDELRAYDDGLYRIDKTYTRAQFSALNEAMVHDYLALSTYLSSQDGAAVRMLNELGYSMEGTFSMRFASPLVLPDSLLGVKYVSASSCPAGYEDVGLTAVGESLDMGAKKFYRNSHALPLAYGVDDGAVGFGLDRRQNPFERQNDLVGALLGQRTELYKPLEVDEQASSSDEVSVSTTVPAGMIGYVYLATDEPFVMNEADKSVWLCVDGANPIRDNYRWYHAVTALGDAVDNDELHSVVITPREGVGSVGTMPKGAKLVLYYLDVPAFESVIQRLAANPGVFSVFQSGHIELSYQAAEDGYVMVTIPATKGWTAHVNGAEVSVESACDGGLMLVPVEKGANEIRLDFVSPGFVVGACVSVVVLAFLVAFCLIRRKRSHVAR